jgi:hypothetical protein
MKIWNHHIIKSYTGAQGGSYRLGDSYSKFALANAVVVNPWGNTSKKGLLWWL